MNMSDSLILMCSFVLTQKRASSQMYLLLQNHNSWWQLYTLLFIMWCFINKFLSTVTQTFMLHRLPDRKTDTTWPFMISRIFDPNHRPNFENQVCTSTSLHWLGLTYMDNMSNCCGLYMKATTTQAMTCQDLVLIQKFLQLALTWSLPDTSTRVGVDNVVTVNSRGIINGVVFDEGVSGDGCERNVKPVREGGSSAKNQRHVSNLHYHSVGQLLQSLCFLFEISSK